MTKTECSLFQAKIDEYYNRYFEVNKRFESEKEKAGCIQELTEILNEVRQTKELINESNDFETQINCLGLIESVEVMFHNRINTLKKNDLNKK